MSRSLLSLVVLLGALVCLCHGARVRYDGFSLIRAPATFAKVEKLVENFPDLDIWAQTRSHVDFLVSPHMFSQVVSHFNGDYEIVTKDIQTLIDGDINHLRSVILPICF